MNLRDLEAFLAVVETGSVGAAARQLHLTQPAVTRRVQNLERDLGATLLRRDSKPPRPSVDGEVVATAGRNVLRAVEDLRASIAVDGEPSGLLRLGLAQAVGEMALGKPIGVLRRAYPRLSLQLHSGWTPELIAQVAAGALDAAAVLLRAGREPADEVTGEPVTTEEVLVVASERLDIPNAVRLRDLAHIPWVLNPEGCGYRTAIRRALERQQLPFCVAVDIIGPDAQLSTVAEGVGLGLVPARALAVSRYLPRLRAIVVEDFRFSVRIWVLTRRALGRLQAPVACFRAALGETLASVD
jgi:DNA-binding transcriptional LysR family regulator